MPRKSKESVLLSADLVFFKKSSEDDLEQEN